MFSKLLQVSLISSVFFVGAGVAAGHPAAFSFDSIDINLPGAFATTALGINADGEEKWCDCRCLKALYRILGANLSFNGLSDSWSELRAALQDVRAFARTELTADELKDVDDLIRAADRALHR